MRTRPKPSDLFARLAHFSAEKFDTAIKPRSRATRFPVPDNWKDDHETIPLRKVAPALRHFTNELRKNSRHRKARRNPVHAWESFLLSKLAGVPVDARISAWRDECTRKAVEDDAEKLLNIMRVTKTHQRAALEFVGVPRNLLSIMGVTEKPRRGRPVNVFEKSLRDERNKRLFAEVAMLRCLGVKTDAAEIVVEHVSHLESLEINGATLASEYARWPDRTLVEKSFSAILKSSWSEKDAAQHRAQFKEALKRLKLRKGFIVPSYFSSSR
jgi:hypothetical protein